MKLIIDIPKEIYARCKKYKLWSYDAETLEGAVAQGIPLDNDSERAETQAYFAGEAYGWEQGRKALIDDVKAEIFDKAIKGANGEGFIFLGRLWRIFDNIGKERNE